MASKRQSLLGLFVLLAMLGAACNTAEGSANEEAPAPEVGEEGAATGARSRG